MKVKGSFEVEEFSSSKYPEADISVAEDHGGPKPYQFELLVAGLQCPKLEISLCFSLTPSGTVLPAATIVRPCDGLKGNTAVLWHFDSSQTYRTSPNHCAKLWKQCAEDERRTKLTSFLQNASRHFMLYGKDTDRDKTKKQNPQSYLPLRASTFQHWGGKNSPLTGRNNMGILVLYSLPYLYSIITRELSLRDSLWKSYTIWILDIGKLKWYLLGLLAILILICGNIEVKVSILPPPQ